MKRFLSLSPFVFLFVLVACSTTLTLPEGSLYASVQAVPNIAFLPPIGEGVDTTDFFADAELRFEIYELVSGAAGAKLSPSFSTADGSIRVADDHYHANWKVSDTVSAHPGVTQFRVEVWHDDAPADAVCLDAPGGACLLGTFDAHLRGTDGEAGAVVLNPKRTLPIKVFFGEVDTPVGPPTTINELFPLVPVVDPPEPFDPAGPNCMAHEFSVPSQGFNALGAGFNALGAGFNALGAVGGLLLLEPGPVDPTAEPIRLIPQDEVGGYLAGLDGGSNPQQSAAILVVDDFGDADPDPFFEDPYFELDLDFFNLPDPTAAGLEALVQNGAFSHGALVLRNVVEAAIDSGFDTFEYADPDFMILSRSADAALPDSEKSFMIVAAVHVGGLDTDSIATRIDLALRVIEIYNQQYNLGVDRIAINMSFVIIPCEVVDDYVASGFDTFEAYADAIAEENGVAEAFRDELLQLLLTAIDPFDDPLFEQTDRCNPNNLPGLPAPQILSPQSKTGIIFPGEGGFFPPLRDVLQNPDEYSEPETPLDPFFPGEEIYCFNGSDRAINYIGSAGNFGQDFPLFPAAWSQVTSVASQDGADTAPYSAEKSSFSNSGEVMAPGALYLLSQGTTGTVDWALAYAGTSFAAPAVSVYTALDLMQTAPLCGRPYVSLLAHGTPFDVALDSAIATYCPTAP